MMKDFYVHFPSLADACGVLEKIEATLGERWAEPIFHPFETHCLLPWNLEYLNGLEDIIIGRSRLSPDDAFKAGFDIGYHRGKFAQAERKIEEGRFILEMIPAALSVPNFSACRALFYGFQSSIYSTREALERSCRRIGPAADKWWKDTDKNIKTNEPFLNFLHVDYNRDKHGEASGILIPSLREYGYIGPEPDVSSAEGVFMIENKGTLHERRVFFPNPNCEMSIRIDFNPQIIEGSDVSALPLVEKLYMVVDYFDNLVREAKVRFSE